MSGEHTPGPWSWFGNAKNSEVYLATTHSGRRYVMGFQRWGMRGGQPTFQPEGRGLVPASKLLTFEVGDQSVRGVDAAKADDSVYRLDISGIDCADARLMCAAPDLLAALEALVPSDIGEHPGDFNFEWHDAVAAIAKARGIPDTPTQVNEGDR